MEKTSTSHFPPAVCQGGKFHIKFDKVITKYKASQGQPEHLICSSSYLPKPNFSHSLHFPCDSLCSSCPCPCKAQMPRFSSKVCRGPGHDSAGLLAVPKCQPRRLSLQGLLAARVSQTTPDIGRIMQAVSTLGSSCPADHEQSCALCRAPALCPALFEPLTIEPFSRACWPCLAAAVSFPR